MENMIRKGLRKEFLIARHVVTSDSYLVHEDDADKLGSDEKIGVYEADPVGFKKPVAETEKGTYFYKPRIFIGRYLEKV